MIRVSSYYGENLLIRKKAIKLISDQIRSNPIVSANGFISRDLFNVNDKPSNFYMIGSMGLTSSIALGIALKNPTKKIFIFDGDGNILMNLGSLTTIGYIKPKNLVHIVFDNSSHESTGGQPTNTTSIKIDKIAKACNYNKVFKIKKDIDVSKIFKEIKKFAGPIMILIKIDISNKSEKRIGVFPSKIKQRFMKSLSML